MMFKPQLAAKGVTPEGPGWLHAVKLDGYRCQCHLRDGVPAFYSRLGQNLTESMGPLVLQATRLGIFNVVLDGELVVFDGDGKSDLQDLKRTIHRRSLYRDRLQYCAFDVLSLFGTDLRHFPYSYRYSLLEQLLAAPPEQFNLVTVTKDPAPIKRLVAAMGLEGIVSKRADSRYYAGRSSEWIKCKPHYGEW